MLIFTPLPVRNELKFLNVVDEKKLENNTKCTTHYYLKYHSFVSCLSDQSQKFASGLRSANETNNNGPHYNNVIIQDNLHTLLFLSIPYI